MRGTSDRGSHDRVGRRGPHVHHLAPRPARADETRVTHRGEVLGDARTGQAEPVGKTGGGRRDVQRQQDLGTRAPQHPGQRVGPRHVRDVEDRARSARRVGQLWRAGADGLFVPGLLDPDVLAELCTASPLPVNVMAGPGAPSVADLAAVGVRRVTVGISIAQAAYSVAFRATAELLRDGTFGALEGALDFGTVNGMFAEPLRR